MTMAFQVTFDANDPALLADFWATALGYIIQPPPEGFDSWDDWAADMGIPEENWNDASALVDPTGEGPRIFFQRVPERKTAKNRVHLDVNVAEGLPAGERRPVVEAAADRLAGAGATIVGPMDERGSFWIVMLDPEGNEFCLQ
ncbi:MAG: VOC family protein [Acidimicrobiia bacterium]|nr:VOC family protein [Acidimicrobiia bacterium]